MTAPAVLLAKAWDPATDPTGWWMSEKLDGVRAVWDGRRLVSRLGNTFGAPEWFVEGLPTRTTGRLLDGELWMGRGEFQVTTSVVRSGADKGWDRVLYRVFDAPETEGGFEARQTALARIAERAADHVQVVSQMRCTGRAHLEECLDYVIANGGEGLMLRRAGSRYIGARSDTLLKVKRFKDGEALVIGYVPGKGKNAGRLGALRCQLPDGTSFDVGTGFSDVQRDRPPRIGAKVTVKYQELSRDGVPRFPVFLAARDYE